jgi:hypothetical protein
MGHAVAVHDVLGVDAWPHDDAQLGKLRAHFAEPFRERTLRGVELARAVQQCRALGVVRGELALTVWDAAIARRILDRGHSELPLDRCAAWEEAAAGRTGVCRRSRSRVMSGFGPASAP